MYVCLSASEFRSGSTRQYALILINIVTLNMPLRCAQIIVEVLRGIRHTTCSYSSSSLIDGTRSARLLFAKFPIRNAYHNLLCMYDIIHAVLLYIFNTSIHILQYKKKEEFCVFLSIRTNTVL